MLKLFLVTLFTDATMWRKGIMPWSLTQVSNNAHSSPSLPSKGHEGRQAMWGSLLPCTGARSENDFLLFVLFCTFIHRHMQNCSSFSINMTETSSIKKIATGNSVREETTLQHINHEIIRVRQLFMIKHWRVFQSCDLIASYCDKLVLSVHVSVINSHHSD